MKFIYLFLLLQDAPPPPKSPSAVGWWGAVVSGHNDVSGISIPALTCVTGDQPLVQQEKESYKTEI